MRRQIRFKIGILFCLSLLVIGCGNVPDGKEEIEVEIEQESTEQKGNKKNAVATAEKYDYVALGNSVTCNKVEEELWWGRWGMAATSKKKDYVHLVYEWLKEQSEEPVTARALDLKKWELAKNRDEILLDYEKYFTEETDLITIQTGENITEFKENLEEEYSNLIELIQRKAPNAQILMLGEVLWPAEDIESAKRKVCEEYGIAFIEMTEFLTDYEEKYKSAVGIEVSGEDDKRHTISNEVVAAHPNDEGMECIAELVIAQIAL